MKRVTRIQLGHSADHHAIDEGPIATVQIADQNVFALFKYHAVLSADFFRSNPDFARLVSANNNFCFGQMDLTPFELA